MPCKQNSLLITIHTIIMEKGSDDTHYKDSAVLLNISMSSKQLVTSLAGQSTERQRNDYITYQKLWDFPSYCAFIFFLLEAGTRKTQTSGEVLNKRSISLFSLCTDDNNKKCYLSGRGDKKMYAFLFSVSSMTSKLPCPQKFLSF